jgi:hypothetical protein
VTSRELIRWSSRHERRATRWWASPWVIAIVAGVALHVPVEWRLHASPIAASHAWLAGAIIAFALAFLRVPFQLYWRADAALLAQLPIEGAALLDTALLRCVRAAAATLLATLISAAPLLRLPWRVYAHHAAIACVLAIAAAALLPAVAIWAASLVATNRHTGGARAINLATALATGNPAAAAKTAAPASSGTVLGALPGFASTVVIVAVLVGSPWLVGEATAREVAPVLGGLVLASLAAIIAVRVTAPRVLGTILRDVSALDRQRLAPLEIRPPTALERGVAALLGDAGLPYRKDARLMRRRYPMAYALGALAFLVLAIVGLARPLDPAPWLVATLAGAGVYALALAGRLRRPPIELPRLAATLPISPSARARAKLAWLVVWIALFVGVPTVFALVRVG